MIDSASAIGEQVRSGRLRATDVVATAIEAALDLHDDLNAFTLVDRSGAMARAEGIDRLVAAGKDPGPLAGVPVGLKDLIDQTGLPNTRGSGFPPEVPEHSAPVVRRLGAAGAVIIGRTGLHEFAFGFTSENHFFGPVRNPWDTTTSAGGSSGGSGAAVAARIVPIGIGTDTGGSVRVPAALCGIFGLKVTHGRVPLTGVYPLAPSLDTVGPLATSVADITASYLAIAGYEPSDGWSAPVNPVRPGRREANATTIGVVKQWVELGPRSEQVANGFNRFLDEAAKAGFTIEMIDEPALAPPARLAHAAGPEILTIHGERFAADPGGYGPLTRERLAQASQGTVDDVLEAVAWSASARNLVAALARSGIDILTCPTVGGLRKVIGDEDMEIDGNRYFHRELLASFTAPINRIGLPALAAPVSGSAGVPVSVQLIAPMWTENVILETAGLLERLGVLGSPVPPMADPTLGGNGSDDPAVQ
jgi:Asp-tRNA(Asn)/Glu-tRNA(Gln) amidotransferase A subunit family amidase